MLGIGGLGHLAVQYAKAAGFETIAVSHSPDKDKLIRDLGADEIVRDGKSLAAAGGEDVINRGIYRRAYWRSEFRQIA